MIFTCDQCGSQHSCREAYRFHLNSRHQLDLCQVKKFDGIKFSNMDEVFVPTPEALAARMAMYRHSRRYEGPRSGSAQHRKRAAAKVSVGALSSKILSRDTLADTAVTTTTVTNITTTTAAASVPSHTYSPLMSLVHTRSLRPTGRPCLVVRPVTTLRSPRRARPWDQNRTHHYLGTYLHNGCASSTTSWRQ